MEFLHSSQSQNFSLEHSSIWIKCRRQVWPKCPYSLVKELRKRKTRCSHWHDYMTLLTNISHHCDTRKNMQVGKELSGSQGRKILPVFKTQTPPKCLAGHTVQFTPRNRWVEREWGKRKTTLGKCACQQQDTFISRIHQKQKQGLVSFIGPQRAYMNADGSLM